jgi:hypothetical protein
MRLVVGALLLVAAGQAPALAETGSLEGRVGVPGFPFYPATFGVDAEVGPRGGAWRVGGVMLAQYTHRGVGYGVYPHTTSVWGWYGSRLPNGDEVGGILGLNYFFKGATDPASTVGPWSYLGPIVGFTYTVRSGPLSVRLSPHYVFSSGPTWGSDWFLQAGLPWFEVGYQITPHLLASLRFTETVFGLSWIL